MELLSHSLHSSHLKFLIYEGAKTVKLNFSGFAYDVKILLVHSIAGIFPRKPPYTQEPTSERSLYLSTCTNNNDVIAWRFNIEWSLPADVV